jgi:uncharacterized membrane protein
VLVQSAGFCLAMYWSVLLTLAPAAHFVATNQLDVRARLPAALGAVLFPLLSVGAVALGARRRPELWEKLDELGEAVLPALALPLVITLLSRAAWRDATTELLLLTGAVAVFLEHALRRALPRWRALWPAAERLDELGASRRFRWILRVLLGVLVLFYAARVSSLTIMNHRRLGTFSADLAEFDSLFFNTLHGHPFRSPPIDGALEDWSALKVHFELLLYALLPFYAARPGPETLLVLQSVMIALTAVPLYAFAARRVGEPLALLFAFALLLMPAVEQPNFYDFHFLPLGLLCVMTVIALADRAAFGPEPRRRWSVLLALAIGAGLLSREDIALGLGILGLVLWASRGAPRGGLLIAAVSFGWYGIVRFVVMPRFGEMWFLDMYAALQAPGTSGASGVVATLLTNPGFVLRKLWTVERLRYVLELTVPLAFLWVRRPWLLVAALPGLPFTLLVTDREPLFSTAFQYVYHWIPYVFAASVLGLEALGKEAPARRTSAAAALCFATLIVSYHQGAFLGARSIRGGPLQVPLRSTGAERRRAAQLEHVLATLPPDAAVAATEHEGPHVSTRLLSFTFYAARAQRPTYILLTERAMMKGEYPLFQALGPEGYRVVAQDGEFALLERGDANEATHELLERLAQRFER